VKQSNVEPITLTPPNPVARPIMLQGWYNVAQIHWRYEPSVVQALLPKGFTVDTFDGSAWVGLIPFEMRRIRLPFGPNDGLGVGRFGTFPETNVRTYIRDRRGRRGVWFFSLDINRVAATLVARTGYGLPYCTATMSIDCVKGQAAQPEQTNQPGQGSIIGPAPTTARTLGGVKLVDSKLAVVAVRREGSKRTAPALQIGDTLRYRSSRNWPKPAPGSKAKCDVEIRIGDPITVEDDSLTAFLTARWALGSTFFSRLLWAEIDHPTWPLHNAELLRCDETVLAPAGLPAPLGPPTALWSPGVEVRIARPGLASRVG
jgi:uncharacterized protein